MTGYVATNISGTNITFSQTMNLRIVKKNAKGLNFVIEQQWVNELTGESEWREVPVMRLEDNHHG